MSARRGRGLRVPPHPFQPDPEAPDWRQRTSACRRCGMPRANKAHAEYVEPEDDSKRILGEHGEGDAA